MKQLTPSQFKKWIASGRKFLLIDIREEREREAYHIGGLHIPMNEIMSRLSEIPKNQSVVFYCEKGIRSLIVVQRLEASGFKNLHNLAGGMVAWQKEAKLSPK